MRIKYNAPTVLTFAFLSAIVLILSQTVMRSLTEQWFLVPGKQGFSASNIRGWITIFTHIFGHANWSHLISNFSFILLIGPILEETYGSFSLFIMICITGAATLMAITSFTRRPARSRSPSRWESAFVLKPGNSIWIP